MSELMLWGKEDCTWLLETHLKNRTDVPEFRCAVIEGNEDCPTSIVLYTDTNPCIAALPIAVFEINEDLTYTKRG
jgi:hypothetical protein